tara:strand:+ start:250 stop:561 length:312 start_codon:yes stop_codon:yes gene_type:complete
MDTSFSATSLVGFSSENFSNYVKNLNQATNGQKSIPEGYQPDTVKDIYEIKSNQKMYDDTFSRNKEVTDNMSKMNRTEDIDIYNETGIQTINKGKGRSIDISA